MHKPSKRIRLEEGRERARALKRKGQQLGHGRLAMNPSLSLSRHRWIWMKYLLWPSALPVSLLCTASRWKLLRRRRWTVNHHKSKASLLLCTSGRVLPYYCYTGLAVGANRYVFIYLYPKLVSITDDQLRWQARQLDKTIYKMARAPSTPPQRHHPFSLFISFSFFFFIFKVARLSLSLEIYIFFRGHMDSILTRI